MALSEMRVYRISVVLEIVMKRQITSRAREAALQCRIENLRFALGEIARYAKNYNTTPEEAVAKLAVFAQDALDGDA